MKESKQDNKVKRVFMLRIKQGVYKKIAAISERNNITMSEVVRRILEKALNGVQ